MTKFEWTVSRLFCLHWALVCALSFAFRVYLLALHTPFDYRTVIYAAVYGAFFDLAVAVYSFAPILLVLLLVRSKKAFVTLMAIDVFVFLFELAAQFFFYDEFKDRFNFIAVDYLVYTHEVLQNVWQSYPIVPIISTLAVLSAGTAVFLVRRFLKDAQLDFEHWRSPVRVVGFYAVAVGLCVLAMTESRAFVSATYLEELVAKNGLHALFAAYRNNEIDFDRFYTETDKEGATRFVHNVLMSGGRHPTAYIDDTSIVRNIHEPEPAKNLNVVLVVMESLSARFMKAYGNPHDLTPNLDRFAQEGLFFDRVYATGTRTVRGLEAITLSIPPTPGQSIVRRPGGVGIFNIGTVFREQKYATNFIYGGRGLFDNMGAFFSGNGFEVHDQSTFPAGEIGFVNAWGVSDEDLFNQALKISDASFAKNQKFFHLILNTSNHRPYTYPDGRVAIPSGKGRDGAVQYSDYAIGKFIKDASTKPWFNDTLFIFVADHNAAVAGKSQIDPRDYLIPFIMYAPKWIKPEINHHLGSQIDLAPTLFEFLNVSYQSRFFGMELQEEDPKRAFVGTYQSVGYLDENLLTVLSPNRKVDEYSWDGQVAKLIDTRVVAQVGPHDKPNLLATVSFYKAASDWFTGRLLEEKRRVSKEMNRTD